MTLRRCLRTFTLVSMNEEVEQRGQLFVFSKLERVKLIRRYVIISSRVARRSTALHLSARSVTAEPGSIPVCITTGRDREAHKAAHTWPQRRPGLGRPE